MVFVFFCDNTAHVFPGSVLTILDAEMWKKIYYIQDNLYFCIFFRTFSQAERRGSLLTITRREDVNIVNKA